MTGHRRTRANQLNARKSTGPRSIHGKRRAAKNARRHGLSLPVISDPVLAEDVLRLAKLIAGEGADPRRLEAASRIAEPQIDLNRLRRVRLSLLNDQIARTKPPTTEETLRGAASLLDEPKDPAAVAQFQSFKDRQAGKTTEALELGLEFLVHQMMRLDRYERRALSRRKKAIRAFYHSHASLSVGVSKLGGELASSKAVATISLEPHGRVTS